MLGVLDLAEVSRRFRTKEAKIGCNSINLFENIAKVRSGKSARMDKQAPARQQFRI